MVGYPAFYIVEFVLSDGTNWSCAHAQAGYDGERPPDGVAFGLVFESFRGSVGTSRVSSLEGVGSFAVKRALARIRD